MNAINGYLEKTKNILYTGKLEKLSSPIEVYIEMTNQCNLNCIYCYKKNRNISEKIIFDKRYLSNILEPLHISSSGPVLFVLEGGEPFLHQDIIDIIQIIKKYGHSIDILTNGECFNENIIKKLSEVIDVESDEIQISLDGITENSLKNRNNNPEKIIDNIRKLNLFKIIPRINIVVTKNNINDIPGLLDFIDEKVSVSAVSINAVMGKNNKMLQASIEAREKLCEDIRTNSYSFTVMLSVMHNICDELSCDLNVAEKSDYYRRCTALTGKVCISANGDVYPCVFYEGKIPAIGSVKNRSLMEIWNSQEAATFRQNRIIQLERCVTCNNNRNCTQICAGSAL